MPRSIARILLWLRWRPRFSVALVALVVALTAFTAASIGWLAWREQRAQTRALADAMGIGVHVGPVVAGNIGSRDRVKYGVVGSPVNLAARIQAIAFGGEILLSGAVVDRVRGAVRAGAALPRAVAGPAGMP